MHFQHCTPLVEMLALLRHKAYFKPSATFKFTVENKLFEVITWGCTFNQAIYRERLQQAIGTLANHVESFGLLVADGT